jgi:hypothetical protein
MASGGCGCGGPDVDAEQAASQACEKWAWPAELTDEKGTGLFEDALWTWWYWDGQGGEATIENGLLVIRCKQDRIEPTEALRTGVGRPLGVQTIDSVSADYVFKLDELSLRPREVQLGTDLPAVPVLLEVNPTPPPGRWVGSLYALEFELLIGAMVKHGRVKAKALVRSRIIQAFDDHSTWKYSWLPSQGGAGEGPAFAFSDQRVLEGVPVKGPDGDLLMRVDGMVDGLGRWEYTLVDIPLPRGGLLIDWGEPETVAANEEALTFRVVHGVYEPKPEPQPAGEDEKRVGSEVQPAPADFQGHPSMTKSPSSLPACGGRKAVRKEDPCQPSIDFAASGRTRSQDSPRR